MIIFRKMLSLWQKNEREKEEKKMAFICELLYLQNSDPYPPWLAETGSFIILLCLTPDNFTCQGRASGLERVNYVLRLKPNQCKINHVKVAFPKKQNIRAEDKVNHTSFGKLCYQILIN